MKDFHYTMVRFLDGAHNMYISTKKLYMLDENRRPPGTSEATFDAHMHFIHNKDKEDDF